eukprot:1964597-Pyramimonas_sp.AAC.1
MPIAAQHRWEIPSACWQEPFNIVSHTTDRSSINSSLLHFLINENYLFVPWFDTMHAMWNAVKNSASKKHGHGLDGAR